MPSHPYSGLTRWAWDLSATHVDIWAGDMSKTTSQNYYAESPFGWDYLVGRGICGATHVDMS